jgi:hypothetical protein
MQIKTIELTGVRLDWAVAAALYEQDEEDRVVKVCRFEPTTPAWVEVENSPGSAPHFHRFSPSTNWAQGGPIIEREGICIERYRNIQERYRDINEEYFWIGRFSECIKLPDGKGLSFFYREGNTPLIAGMRCYVASVLGDEIDIPTELISI